LRSRHFISTNRFEPTKPCSHYFGFAVLLQPSCDLLMSLRVLFEWCGVLVLGRVHGPRDEPHERAVRRRDARPARGPHKSVQHRARGTTTDDDDDDGVVEPTLPPPSPPPLPRSICGRAGRGRARPQPPAESDSPPWMPFGAGGGTLWKTPRNTSRERARGRDAASGVGRHALRQIPGRPLRRCAPASGRACVRRACDFVRCGRTTLTRDGLFSQR
jgi:hypothetical protein